LLRTLRLTGRGALRRAVFTGGRGLVSFRLARLAFRRRGFLRRLRQRCTGEGKRTCYH
jgi:hypothetical protein